MDSHWASRRTSSACLPQTLAMVTSSSARAFTLVASPTVSGLDGRSSTARIPLSMVQSSGLDVEGRTSSRQSSTAVEVALSSSSEAPSFVRNVVASAWASRMASTILMYAGSVATGVITVLK